MQIFQILKSNLNYKNRIKKLL